MATWNYTKKIIMDNKSVEGRAAHEAAFLDRKSYQDWYYEQVDAMLADKTTLFIPHKFASDIVLEFLVTDQAQADSYIAMAYAVAERIGYPLSATVVDVDYTTDTIPDDFIIP